MKKHDFDFYFDEAGKGALAGPVVVGCICINSDKNFQKKFILENLKSIKDSKKFSEKKRKSWYEKILEILKISKYKNDFFYSTGFVENHEIDQFKITRSIEIACIRAISKIKIKNHNFNKFYFDGYVNLRKDFPKILQISEPKLDEKNSFCACASILAKVQRDEFMKTLKTEPEFDFKSHKGYGTKSHREKIIKFGRTKYHRKSFLLKHEKHEKQKNQSFNFKSKRKTGKKFENLAKKILEKQNYKILKSNFEIRHIGEIDIIAIKNQTIFFFEVKYRKNTLFGSAVESVDFAKKKRMIKTSEIFLQKKENKKFQNLNREYRLIAIQKN